MLSFFFFLNDTATPEIYPLPLHDALPIYAGVSGKRNAGRKSLSLPSSVISLNTTASAVGARRCTPISISEGDRKSTRLNSSHSQISYAVFCLKKKKTTHYTMTPDSQTADL